MLKEKADYISIHPRNISVDSILDFDLYRDIGGEPRLYRDRSISFTMEDLNNLIDNGVDYLYIPSSQKDIMYDSLRKKLPTLLKDKSIPLEQKMEILSETSVNILGRALGNPMSSSEVKGVVSQCKCHIDVAMMSDEAKNHLVNYPPQAPHAIVHALSVGNLSILLGLNCDITDSHQLHELGVSGLLHEIGKTMLDRDYYYQPSLLGNGGIDPRQEKYPIIGRDLLSASKVISENSLKAVAEHKERLDGSGYPNKLGRNAIGKMSRIVAICDAYDEAISVLSTGQRMKPFEALSILKGQSSKYDQEILVMFITMLGNITSN